MKKDKYSIEVGENSEVLISEIEQENPSDYVISRFVMMTNLYFWSHLLIDLFFKFDTDADIPGFAFLRLIIAVSCLFIFLFLLTKLKRFVPQKVLLKDKALNIISIVLGFLTVQSFVALVLHLISK